MRLKNSPVILFTILWTLSTATSVFSQKSQGGSIEWWKIPFPETFKSDGFKNTLSFIHVKGNKFIDEEGNVEASDDYNFR